MTILHCLRFETLLSAASYDLQGHGGGIRTHLHTGYCYCSYQCYVTTDGLSWNKAPIWGLWPDYYCQTVAGLLIWGTVSDKRTGLSFIITAGPCQSSHSWVQVPQDSRPYFTLSGSRLPFLLPPMTHRAMVEVFNPASIWDYFSFKNALFYLCLAYRIEVTKSNSSSLRCHENDPSIAVRTNVVVWTAPTHPLCRKRLSTFPDNTLSPPSAIVAEETCSNNLPPM
jgi:hypothetical protein